MEDIRTAWGDFVHTFKRVVLSEFRRVTFERGERIRRRILAWRRPEEWVPVATYLATVEKMKAAMKEAAALSWSIAEMNAKPNLAAMVNDEGLDKLRHHAMMVGGQAGNERGLRDAGAIKQWREARELRKLVAKFRQECDKASWGYDGERFSDLEESAGDILEFLDTVVDRDGSNT